VKAGDTDRKREVVIRQSGVESKVEAQGHRRGPRWNGSPNPTRRAKTPGFTLVVSVRGKDIDGEGDVPRRT